MMGQRGDMSVENRKEAALVKERNRELCKKYPFLLPYAGRKGEADGPPDDWDYDFEYTELDRMPKGWRDAFGTQLCDELKEELVSAGMLDSYRVAEIKEKWGELRWYDTGSTRHGNEILDKYTCLSRHTCILCGKKAKWISRGWISPFCDECVAKAGGSSRADRIEDVYGEER